MKAALEGHLEPARSIDRPHLIRFESDILATHLDYDSIWSCLLEVSLNALASFQLYHITPYEPGGPRDQAQQREPYTRNEAFHDGTSFRPPTSWERRSSSPTGTPPGEPVSGRMPEECRTRPEWRQCWVTIGASLRISRGLGATGCMRELGNAVFSPGVIDYAAARIVEHTPVLPCLC